MRKYTRPTDAVKPLAYPVKEAAAQIGIHPLTLHKLLRAGQIKGARVGRKWVVPRKALEEFLAKGGDVA